MVATNCPPTISQGASGPTVTQLQTSLNHAGAHLVVDGQFGPVTAAAVRTFQQANHLTVDGVAGPLTWGALGQCHPAPPPPPPAQPPFAFLPLPGAWYAALREDFTKPGVSLASLNDWQYGGRPGGTSNCLWLPGQLSFVVGTGAKITTQWDATRAAWVSAGFGTNAKFAYPLRVRWYDVLADANIDGKNKINIVWCDPWIEEGDADECAINNGAWGVSWARNHNNGPKDVTIPLSYRVRQQLGVVTCNEAEWAVVNGVPTYSIFRDGVFIDSTPIPAGDWTLMLNNPHWIGTQDELYATGTGDKTKTSVRYVCGIEVLKLAA